MLQSKIICLNDDKIYEDILECSKVYEVKPSEILKVLENEILEIEKIVNGRKLVFIYLDDFNDLVEDVEFWEV